MKQIKLPGSERNEGGAGAGTTGGRFSPDEWGALAQVAVWWRNRLAAAEASDPLESLIGGVDLRGATRTVGLTPAAVAFGRPLAPSGGAALLVMALGVPDPPAVGEVYSLTALCHFYDAAPSGWLSRETTLGRAPASATTVELRAVLDGATGLPAVQIVGVGGLTIDWTVEALRLEG